MIETVYLMQFLTSQVGVVVAWVFVTLAAVTMLAILARVMGVEIVIGVYASMVVVANLIAFKLVSFGPFIVPAAVIVYASTFLVTDILAEIYGVREARLAIWSGFAANILMIIVVLIAVAWPAAPIVEEGTVEAFNTVMGFAPRVIIASLVAFIISQQHDVWAFHFWKRVTGGRYLWLRNNLSTLVSQLIDTIIFITLAFYGVVATPVLLGLITGQYIVKLIIALMDTPFIYVALWVSHHVHQQVEVIRSRE